MPMATDFFKVDIEVAIQPNWQDTPPSMMIRLDHNTLWDDVLLDTKVFKFSMSLPKGKHALEIELYDKPELDSGQSLTILNLKLGRIQSQQFVWQGIYRPQYPEPWASQQKEQGIPLQSELFNTDQLGWNGTWRLEFTAPIFTWIHQVENHGWIHK